MKRVIIYTGAFILGLISIALGFYLVPIYKLSGLTTPLLGPLVVFLAYFIFGVPPITLYFRGLSKDRWWPALLKGLGIVILNMAFIAVFLAFTMINIAL